MHESNTPVNNQPDFSGSIEVNNQQDLDVPISRIVDIAGRILSQSNFDQGDISIAVVDNQTIHELNRKYLAHDYPTDVLSFVLESEAETKTLNGEVIVSAEMAFQVAAEHGHQGVDELLLYVIHGMLHLVGFGDKTESQQLRMRQQEQKFLEIAGIAGLHVDSESHGNDEHGGQNQACGESDADQQGATR